MSEATFGKIHMPSSSNTITIGVCSPPALCSAEVNAAGERAVADHGGTEILPFSPIPLRIASLRPTALQPRSRHGPAPMMLCSELPQRTEG